MYPFVHLFSSSLLSTWCVSGFVSQEGICREQDNDLCPESWLLAGETRDGTHQKVLSAGEKGERGSGWEGVGGRVLILTSPC